MKILTKHLSRIAGLLLACVVVPMAYADDRESLESLGQRTRGLIEALVEKGVLTRQAADNMLKQSQKPEPIPEAANKPVQRVPYISDAMKSQIRNEVKEEVLTQARAERWGVPNASPSWTDRIKIDGDFSFRIQSDSPDSDNTSTARYVAAAQNLEFARSLDFAEVDDAGNAAFTTTSSRTRERVRVRLGIAAKVSDEVAFGLRLATGNGSDPVSTNQTLGQNFNKYQLFVDRAFVRLTPTEGVDLSLGRIANPWFSTDLIWSDNLNFEGAALTTRWVRSEANWEPFATIGAFPLRANTPPSRPERWLYGAQVGTTWNATERTKLKIGLAYYKYQNIDGREEKDYESTGAQGPTFGQYEYESNLDQKGNTLFVTNADYLALSGAEPSQIYGLAYRFAPVALTMASEFSHFSPYRLRTSFEYVHNTNFSRSDFLRRAGAAYAGTDPGGNPNGYLLKLGFGSGEVREQGDWLTTLTYKHLGSDAVLDAFADSDMGLGGTNVQGVSLGLQYGLYRNTSLGVRHLSSRTIDSPINDANLDAKYGVRTLQVDLNVRF